jgi:hypothetical protein
MDMRILISFLVAFLFSGLAYSEQISELTNGGQYLKDRIIVVTHYDTPTLNTFQTKSGTAVTGIASIDELCAKIEVIDVEPYYRGKLTKPSLKRELSRMYIFSLRDGLDAKDNLDILAADPNIESAELYTIPRLCYTPNDPSYGDQWFLTHIHADDCWDTLRGDSTRHSIIGIVDTGVYWNHPDLAANIWINQAEDVNHNGIFDSADNDGIDADSNGYIDDVVGWDLGSNDNDPAEITPTHGTHMAGCVSEVTDNNLGGAGIGFNARIMCVKASNDQNQLVAAYQGIIYASEQGTDVVNCSWGSTTYSQAAQNIINAVNAAGTMVVAGAGNVGGSTPIYPAAYVGVTGVAPTNQNDHITEFASYGVWVDVCAPGVNILSTWGQSSYTSLDGASPATCLVSGLAGLIRAWHPLLTPDQINTAIRVSADSIGYLNPNYPYAIRINCANWFVYTGINDKPIPNSFSLAQNYPNPFNASTSISYTLPEDADITLTIYNILGQNVQTLLIGTQNAGMHSIIWDATGMPSGIYFYKIRAGKYIDIKRCQLIK